MDQSGTALAAAGQPARAEAVVGRNPNTLEQATALADVAASYAEHGRLPDADRIAGTLEYCDAIRALSAMAMVANKNQPGSDAANARTDRLEKVIAATPQVATCFSALGAAAAFASAGREAAADRLFEQIKGDTSTLHDVSSLLALATEHDRAGLTQRRDAAQDEALELAQKAFITSDREFQLIAVGTALAETRRYASALSVATQLGPSAGDVDSAIVRSYWEQRG